jgi:hypothetical protein
MPLNFFSHWRRTLCAAFLCLICSSAGLWRHPEAQAQTGSQPSSQPILRILKVNAGCCGRPAGITTVRPAPKS